MNVENVDDNFHSRYSALYRDYLYLICNCRDVLPFVSNYCWHVLEKIDLERMKELSRYFVGRRDFSFVANEDNQKNCIREVHFIRIKRIRNFVVVHIRANAFLRGMVRNIVGLLVEYAKGLQKGDAGNIIFSKGNVKSFKAPAKGLFFRRVRYKDDNKG